MKIKYYQLDARMAGDWTPVQSETYCCYETDFRAMFNCVRVLPGQRLRCDPSMKAARYFFDRRRGSLIRWGK